MNLLILGGSEWSKVWSFVHKDRELLRTGTLVSVKTIQDGKNGFSTINPETSGVVVSYLTEACLEGLGSLEEDTRLSQIPQFLTELMEGPGGIFAFCRAFPKIRFMANFPVVRGTPYWYPVLRGSILRNLQAITFNSPPNFTFLSEITAELDREGTGLVLVWAMAYVKSTIDQVELQIKVPIPETQDRADIIWDVQNSITMGLEARMSRLENRVSLNDAVLSEESDNCANERDLDRFVIQGLSKLKGPSQDDLRRQVADYVRQLISSFAIESIIWVRTLKSPRAIYNVQLSSVEIATSVKTSFASAVKAASPPSCVKNVSISFVHTLGTRVRLSLLRSVTKRQIAKEKECICTVTSFTARPMLRYGFKTTGIRFYTFVQAMEKFGSILEQTDLDRALSLCTSMRGRLRDVFIVLSDERKLPPPPSNRGQRRPREEDDSEQPGRSRAKESRSN